MAKKSVSNQLPINQKTMANTKLSQINFFGDRVMIGFLPGSILVAGIKVRE